MTLRAAAYVRMSDARQEESPEVQIARIREFCAEKGWTFDEQHIYRDDARSRAEFKRRPALAAMLRDAERHAFDAIVLRDDDRLGGDLYRSGMILTTLVDDCGVQVWYYHSGQQVRLDDPTSKIIQAVKGYASELERLKTSERTRENHEHKAKRGHVAGGACFGYVNHEILNADGKRDHVEWQIHPEQADVVRAIFEAAASGHGVRAIVHDLNARGVPSPRAGRVGTGSWSPSCVFAILRRERYRGRIVWGKTHKIYQGGTKKRIDRQTGVVTVEAEHLRIIPEQLWQAVREQLGRRRMYEPGRKGPQGCKPRGLLSGLVRCAHCGGPLQVANGKTSYRTTQHYSCGWHRHRGPAVCPVSLHRPIESLDNQVLAWLRAELLTEAVVERFCKELRRRLAERASTADRRLPQLEKRIGELDAELRKLGAALLTTETAPATIVQMIAERERVRDRLRGELEAARAAPASLDLEVRRLQRAARKRLADLRSMLEGQTAEARRALEAVLAGPIVAEVVQTPDGPRFEIRGEAALGGLLHSKESVPNGSRTLECRGGAVAFRLTG